MRVGIWTLILIVSFPLISAAQSGEKGIPVWNQHKNEIGLDFQGIFSNGSVGSNFVYKRRFGDESLESLTKTKAFRLQGYFNSDHILSKDTSELFNNNFLNTGANQSSLNYKRTAYNGGLSLGIEWQHQKGRFQYFYGVDLGGGYRFFNQFNSVGRAVDPTGAILYNIFEITNYHIYSIDSRVFGGAKYFINKRLSISVESAFNLGTDFESSIERIFYDNSDDAQESRKSTETSYYTFFDYLRTMNLSYYF